MECVARSLAWFCLMTGAVHVVVVGAQEAEASHSTLGLEPGDHRLCNDDIGVILWGPDERPTLSIGKSDVWDRRLPPTERPVLTAADMERMARAGDPELINGRAYYTGYNSYDFPCPKPVGQAIVKLPFLEGGGTLTTEQGERATRLLAENGPKRLELRLFVSAVRNLIVIDGEGVALEAGDVAIRLWRHRDTIVPGGDLHPTLTKDVAATDFEQLAGPHAGTYDQVFWVSQDFPAEMTFPNGFQVVFAGRLSGTDAAYDVVEGERHLGTPMIAPEEGQLSPILFKRHTPINEAPGAAVTATLPAIDGAFSLLISVVTTQDDPDPLDRAKDELEKAAKLGTTFLWDEHNAQLDKYEDRPHARAWSADGSIALDLPWGGIPYRARPAGYYGDVPLCSVDSTKFCFQDSGRWHGDFHLNEVDATVPCIQRQFDWLDPYFRMIQTMLPMAQMNAREVYDCAGAMYPLVHYPLKAESVIHTSVSWEQSMEITALLARPFWLRFLYTWDKDFLATQAYPVLREGARFYADYLKLEDDGLYHVFPTVSPEHRGITKDLALNKDTQSGITLIRYHLRAAARAAAILDVDQEEAAKWQSKAERMPEYPTVDTPEGPIYIDVAGAEPMEYNIAVPLTAVFWGDDIGLDSPPEQIELAKRTLDQIDVWEPHQGYLRTVRRRLGMYRPEDGMNVENLLQSHTGVIRLFPAVPDDFEGGFENLGAQGAFVVSAKHDARGPYEITIQSLAGNACSVHVPWPGREGIVVDATTETEVAAFEEGGNLHFQTSSGRIYELTASSDR